MSKSVAPELKQYLRTKFAEPNGLDMYNQYAPDAPGMPTQTPSLAGLSRDEIAAAGTGPESNALTYDGVMDRIANNPYVEGISNWFDGARREVGTNARVFAEYANKNPLYNLDASAPGRGLHRAADAMSDPKNSDRPWAAGLEAAFYGGQDPAAQAAAGQADTQAAPTASIGGASATPKQDAMFPLSNSTAYGLSGAGAGALLGAAMSRKGKRGRNALLGAGLGGGAGLLANYLMNQKKAGLYAPKTPVNYNPELHKMLQTWEQSDAGKKFWDKSQPISPEIAAALVKHMKLKATDTPDDLDAMHTLLELDDAQPKPEFAIKKLAASRTKSATGMLHDALGMGAGGAVIGGLYGALTAKKKNCLGQPFVGR
jgi:hypothetical protein